jgi:hypothetical protein
MKLKAQTYILVAILILFCINAVYAVSGPFGISGTNDGDTVKVAKVLNSQDKIKLVHRPSENLIRIETEYLAAQPLTAEIINMIGVSCKKSKFRVNTTLDYNLKPGVYFVLVYLNNQRVSSSKIVVSQ